MIRILLVDDHPVVRAGLRALVEGQDDLTVVAEADSLESALAAVEEHRPDVVLMDLSLGAAEKGGVEATPEGDGHLVARDALVELGYSLGDAESVLAAIDPALAPEERVRLALRQAA